MLPIDSPPEATRNYNEKIKKKNLLKSTEMAKKQPKTGRQVVVLALTLHNLYSTFNAEFLAVHWHL
jgi:hypothetical protein